MNFLHWLVKRMNKYLFNNWRWIEKYRELILHEKPLSIFLTMLCGIFWFLICALFVIWLVDDRQLGAKIMQGTILCVPMFYVYNWIAALYEIYNTERMAVWDKLKDPV